MLEYQVADDGAVDIHQSPFAMPGHRCNLCSLHTPLCIAESLLIQISRCR